MKWIKCSDKLLPYPGVNVLLGRSSETTQEVTLGWFRRGVWQYLDGTEIEDIPVKWKSDFSGSDLSYWTHWMPLPDPPPMQPD